MRRAQSEKLELERQLALERESNSRLRDVSSMYHDRSHVLEGEIDEIALDRWRKEKVIARTKARAAELMVRETRTMLAGRGLYDARHNLKENRPEYGQPAPVPVRRFQPDDEASVDDAVKIAPRCATLTFLIRTVPHAQPAWLTGCRHAGPSGDLCALNSLTGLVFAASPSSFFSDRKSQISNRKSARRGASGRSSTNAAPPQYRNTPAPLADSRNPSGGLLPSLATDSAAQPQQQQQPPPARRVQAEITVFADHTEHEFTFPAGGGGASVPAQPPLSLVSSSRQVGPRITKSVPLPTVAKLPRLFSATVRQPPFPHPVETNPTQTETATDALTSVYGAWWSSNAAHSSPVLPN